MCTLSRVKGYMEYKSLRNTGRQDHDHETESKTNLNRAQPKKVDQMINIHSMLCTVQYVFLRRTIHLNRKLY